MLISGALRPNPLVNLTCTGRWRKQVNAYVRRFLAR